MKTRSKRKIEKIQDLATPVTQKSDAPSTPISDSTPIKKIKKKSDAPSTPISDSTSIKQKSDAPSTPTSDSTRDRKRDFLMCIRTKKMPKDKDFKTTVLIDPSMIPTPERASFNERMSEKMSQISTHRPIKTPDAKCSTPETVYTPESGTALHLTNNHGAIAFYSSDPKTSPITKKLTFMEKATRTLQDENHPFFESKSYESVREPEGTTKHQTLFITQKKLKKVKKKIEDNHGRRSCTQNKVMVKPGVNAKYGSATDFMQKTQLLPKTQRSEWGHLIGHGQQGDPAQNPDNLVILTTHCNTDMMFIEYCINYIVTHYPEGITLDVDATLIEKTQIGNEIHYRLTTPDFKIEMTYDCQNLTKPYITNKEYMRALVETLIETYKKKQSTPTKPQPVKSHSIFKPKKTPISTPILPQSTLQPT